GQIYCKIYCKTGRKGGNSKHNVRCTESTSTEINCQLLEL
ncbi:hypothetical protein DOY81_005921, partial [Sarcophaga bullata]